MKKLSKYSTDNLIDMYGEIYNARKTLKAMGADKILIDGLTKELKRLDSYALERMKEASEEKVILQAQL